MDAGRELDALVAEKIMGDVRDHWTWIGTDGSTFTHMDGGPRLYSADIDAAWRIVEAMRAQGLHLLMNDTLIQYRAQFFAVDSASDSLLWRRRMEDGAYYEFADSAPHAICLAALRAVGAKET